MLGELVEFLVEEMAMDGQEGCSLARLDDFISAFASRHQSKNPSYPPLKLDDAFKDFVWRQLVALSHVRVGVLERSGPQTPDGDEVAGSVEPSPGVAGGQKSISATVRAKKAAAKRAQKTWTWRELGEEEKKDGRMVLATRYAKVDADEPEDGRLRIGADPKTCLRAMLGSDIVSPRITPYVYEILCIVTRGRGDGATVVEIGMATPHDQKSSYHFVQVLVELGLVEKFQVAHNKVRTNRVVHRRYLETSQPYLDFIGHSRGKEQADDGAADEEGQTQQMLMADLADLSDAEDESNAEAGPMEGVKLPQFPPILTPINNVSDAVLRSRVEQVLRQCVGYTMHHAQVIIAVGMANPTKRDRRRINRSIDIWAEEGFVEKVWIEGKSRNTPCIRLVDHGDQPAAALGSFQPIARSPWNEPESSEQSVFVPAFTPMSRQILDLIQAAGEEGTTYRDMWAPLAHFNSRSIESALLATETAKLPPHLSDLRLCSTTEQAGREKRLRWFISSNFRQRCRAEGVPFPAHLEPEPEAGGFMSFGPEQLCSSVEALDSYLAALSAGKKLPSMLKQRTKKKKKGKRAAKASSPPSETSSRADTPGLPPGTVSGRPRKYPYGTTPNESTALRKKLAQGLDITDDVRALEEKYGNMSREDWLAKKTESRNRTATIRRLRKEKGEAAVKEFLAAEKARQPAKASKKAKRGKGKGKAAEPVEVPEVQDDPVPEPSTGDAVEGKRTRRKRVFADMEVETPKKRPRKELPPTPSGFARTKKRGRPSKADLEERELLRRAEEAGLGDDFGTMEYALEEEAAADPIETSTSQANGRTSPVPDVPSRTPSPALPDDPPTSSRPKKKRRVAIESPKPTGEADGASDNHEDKQPVAVDAVDQFMPVPQADEGLPPPPQTPRNRTAPQRTNLTSIRRENDILDLIRSSGGILECSLEIDKLHRERIAALNPSTASSQTRMDRRTIDSAVASLERKGQIRQIGIVAPDSLHRQTRRQLLIASEIPLDSPQVTRYIHDLQQKAMTSEAATWSHRKTLPTGTPFQPTTSAPVSRAPVNPADWTEWSDETVRAALLKERYISPQHNGWQPGVIARARTLHIELLRLFETSLSPSIRCDGPGKPRILVTSAFFEDLPLGVYLGMVQLNGHLPALEAFRRNPGASTTPLRSLPDDLKSYLKVGTAVARAKIMAVVRRLCQLGVVIPLEPTEETTEHFVCNDLGERAYFKARYEAELRIAFFRVTDVGAIYDLTKKTPEESRPLLRLMPLQTADMGHQYWHVLKELGEGAEVIASPECVGQVREGPPVKVFQELQSAVKWAEGSTLFPLQQAFIRRRIHLSKDAEALVNDQAQLERFADAILSEPHIVKEYIERGLRFQAEKRRRTAEKARKRRQWGLDPYGPPTEQEVASLLAVKVRDAAAQRERDFLAIVARFKADHQLAALDEAGVADLHRRVTSTSQPITVQTVENELERLLAGPSAGPQISATGQAAAMKRLGLGKRRQRKDEREKRVAKVAPAIQEQLNFQPGARPVLVVEGKTRLTPKWDPVTEDFLRDGIAIMRARALAVGRRTVQWSTVYRLFGTKSQALRAQAIRLIESSTERKYLDLLTDAWGEVYREKMLPDDPPGKTDEIDIGRAIDLLRANIDKDYLRFQAEAPPPPSEVAVLPEDPAELQKRFEVAPVSARAKPVQVSNNIQATLSLLTQKAVAMSIDGQTKSVDKTEGDGPARAMEAIKMVLVTSDKRQRDGAIVRLLRQFDQAALTEAASRLQKRGLMVRRNRTFSATSARHFEISPPFLRRFERFSGVGEGRLEHFQETFETDDPEYELEWPIIPTNEEMVALFEGFSCETVDIEVDTLAHEDLRRDGDVTGRKMNDEITEHPVSVSLREPLERSAPPVAQPPPVTKAQVNGVARIVAAAGPSGITTAVLLEALADVMSVSEVAQVVADLVASDSALWAGSTTRLLVDGEHAAVWCPVTQGLGIEAEPRRSRPRIWIDAFGEVEPGMWARARAMVRGVVEDFPGVSEATLQQKVKTALNVVETDDVLLSLLGEGRVATAAPGAEAQPAWVPGFGDAHFWPM